MLEPEFLDVIIERFVKEDSVVAPESRESPPFNNRLLTYIALLKIHRKATLEQIVILLKFLFPALSRYSACLTLSQGQGLTFQSIFQFWRDGDIPHGVPGGDRQD